MPPTPPLDSEHLDDLIFQYVRRDYVPLRIDVTVGQALQSLRSQELGEKIVYFYVVDGEGPCPWSTPRGTCTALWTCRLFTDQLSEARVAEEAFQLIGIHLVAGLGPFAGFKDRFPWLTANIAGGLLAAFVTSLYEPMLDVVVVLALFIPVVPARRERQHPSR